jgi:diguanylate cyclase (GGDEF)-like protein
MSPENSEELRRRLRHMTVLHELTLRLLSALDPDEVVAGVLEALPQLIASDSAAVQLDDAPPDRQTATHVLACGRVAVAVPLVGRDRAVGVLEVTVRAPLVDADLEILERLATAAALALQNARLHQENQRLASTDPLTGLSNYRHFHEQLGLEVQRARRMRYAVGLLMMDVDHFKLINDRHGHPAGDRALQQVAELLRNRLRRTDVIARVGGEEFAVILPGDAVDAVGVVAEQLRKAVEALPPIEGGRGITLSIGGSSLMPDVLDKQALIERADRALYEAKRGGRNQVRLSSSR